MSELPMPIYAITTPNAGQRSVLTDPRRRNILRCSVPVSQKEVLKLLEDLSRRCCSILVTVVSNRLHDLFHQAFPFAFPLPALLLGICFKYSSLETPTALCHDVEHPGVLNAPLVKEAVLVAAFYKNKSVAEQTRLILRGICSWTST
jgi:hypothetical protein